MKGLKICGVSDSKTLKYILNHPHPPKFVGFITNYKKSKRFVEYEKLGNLIDVDKNNVKFILTFSFLKKSSSLNKFNKKTKLIIMKKTNIKDLKNI